MNYRKGFIAVLFINVVLLAGFAWWWFQRDSGRTQGQQTIDAVAAEPTTSPRSQPETPLAPVQLTAQRMQSIGVKLGTVAYKNVSDEIHVTGNVDIDETRVSYVQTRFPGWIRKVYADSTYRYVRKGQPLFTIYSPDLVATEQEYLLARQNQQQLQTSTVKGVSSGAASLANAAEERLAQWEVSPE